MNSSRRQISTLLLSTLGGSLVGTAHAVTAADPGVTDREILIGQVAALSGPSAELGLRLQAGMQAYFAVVNAADGVLGRRIKLISRDDGYEPERAASTAKALIDTDRVFAIAGTVGTPTGLALLPIAAEAKVPVVGMFTGAQSLREPLARNVFHVRASYDEEIELIVAHLCDSVGSKRIAVFYQDDSYGKSGLAGVQKALAKRQLQPAAVGTFKRNSVEVDEGLQTILAAKPEAIVQISAYKPSAAMIKAARAKRYSGQIANVSFVGPRALSAELGPLGRGVIISQVMPSPFHARIPLVGEYQKHMTQAGDKTFDFTSLEGYIVARVLVEGLRRAGQSLTREGLISAIETIKGYNLGGYLLDFSPINHQGSSLTRLTMIGADGNFRS